MRITRARASALLMFTIAGLGTQLGATIPDPADHSMRSSSRRTTRNVPIGPSGDWKQKTVSEQDGWKP
jgi:hypothetical protein